MPALLGSLLDAIVFGRPYRVVAGALAAFGALAIPSSCVVCGRWDSSLCGGCSALFRRATSRPFRAEDAAESLPDVERHRGRAAGGPSTAGTPAPQSPDSPYGPLPVVAAGRYGGAVSLALLAFKNHGHVDLAAPVAAALAGALHTAVSARDPDDASLPLLLVPVPTRASSRRRRGYDPLLLLLSRLDRSGQVPAGTLLAPVVRQVPLLVRLGTAVGRSGSTSLVRTVLAPLLAGWTGGQKGLGRRRRRANVLHSMCVARSMRYTLSGRTCLIVDDVLTTGATIGEVHRVLVDSGARVSGAVVIAATASPAGTGPLPSLASDLS
jgi:predicted amidophosphoribosyltransferase